MRICNLTIRNHRRVPDLQISVVGHLVLVGANGSGKSTVLDILAVVMNGNMAALYRYFQAADVRDVDHALVVEIEFDSLSEEEAAEFAHEVHLDDGAVRLLVCVSCHLDEDSGDLAIERRVGGPGVEARVSHVRLAVASLSHIAAERRLHVALGSGGQSEVQRLLRDVDFGDDAASVDEALDGLQEFVQNSDAIESLGTNVASSLDRLIERAVTDDDVIVGLPPSRRNSPLEMFELQLLDGGTPRSLSDDSDGRQSLTALGLQLLRGRAGILCVDEPEVHLHPASQRRTAAAIRDFAPQAIVATHSPEVLAQFDPRDVVVMPGDGAVRQVDRELYTARRATQRWLPALLEPLTARGVIAVEGPSDVLAIREVARALGIDLDRESITVYPVHGFRYFKDLFELVGPHGFDVPLVSVVDESEEAAVVGYLGYEDDDLEAQGVYTCRTDLEEEVTRALGAVRTIELLCRAEEFKRETILGWAGVDAVDELTDNQVARVMRRNKIDAALALDGQLTNDEARRISPLAKAIESSVEA